MTQHDNLHILGRCPVCGNGQIKEADSAFYCDGGKLPDGRKCSFRIFRKMHGILLDAPLVSQLITEGCTDELPMVNHSKQPFLGRFVIDHGKVDIRMRTHALQGRCPICGGRVLKTGKGYACEYAIGWNAPCVFRVTGLIHGRRIGDDDMEHLLDGDPQVIDGFSTIDGKPFSSVLSVKEDGQVGLDPEVATCPSCGGNILVGPLAYNCSNYRNPGINCKFSLWRSIFGHQVTVEEMRQICEEGRTREPLEMFQNNGAVYYQRLGLSADKKKIIKI